METMETVRFNLVNDSNNTIFKNLFGSLKYNYNYIFDELSDPRTKKWLLIKSPAPTLIILAIYMYAIYELLPKFMKHRPAYSLKNVIFYYNICQITVCTFLVATAIPLLSWTCETVDFSQINLRSTKMLQICYYTYFLKTSELLETMFFVLRKKQNQVSKLHVYHHVSTLMTAWFFTKYFGGSMVLFVMVLNSIMHIIMYTYYLLSSLSPEWQKKVKIWKSTITMLQMIQLSIFIAYSFQVFAPSCRVPLGYAFVFVPNVLINFKMFWNFYKASYLKSTKKNA